MLIITVTHSTKRIMTNIIHIIITIFMTRDSKIHLKIQITIIITERIKNSMVLTTAIMVITTTTITKRTTIETLTRKMKMRLLLIITLINKPITKLIRLLVVQGGSFQLETNYQLINKRRWIKKLEWDRILLIPFILKM